MLGIHEEMFVASRRKKNQSCTIQFVQSFDLGETMSDICQ